LFGSLLCCFLTVAFSVQSRAVFQDGHLTLQLTKTDKKFWYVLQANEKMRMNGEDKHEKYEKDRLSLSSNTNKLIQEYEDDDEKDSEEQESLNIKNSKNCSKSSEQKTTKSAASTTAPPVLPRISDLLSQESVQDLKKPSESVSADNGSSQSRSILYEID
jgi:hypothetical protein